MNVGRISCSATTFEWRSSKGPGVAETITKCNIRNFTIFEHDGLLFSYFEYVGDDFDADMALMAADPETQRWWARTDPCQIAPPNASTGQWAVLPEIWHQD